MSREALKGYLADKAGVTPEVAAAYVDGGDVSGIEQKKAREIIDALDNLKAVDPACGSGAYSSLRINDSVLHMASRCARSWPVAQRSRRFSTSMICRSLTPQSHIR